MANTWADKYDSAPPDVQKFIDALNGKPRSSFATPEEYNDFVESFKNNPHPLWRQGSVDSVDADKLQIDILESIDRARWGAVKNGTKPKVAFENKSKENTNG